MEAQAPKLKTVEYKDGKRVRETERLETIMFKRLSRPIPQPAFVAQNRRKVEWRERVEAHKRATTP